MGGRTVLRLANAEVLPFDPVPIAETTARYAREVQKLADDLREQTEEENRRVRERLYALADDPKLALAAPEGPGAGALHQLRARCRTRWPGCSAARPTTRRRRPTGP